MIHYRQQILKAVAGKVKLAASVDLDEIAEATEGYSGADLQALLYNAHLEVVHQAISDLPAADVPSNRDEVPIEYNIVGGPKEGSKVASKATEMALQRRVSLYCVHLHTISTDTIIESCDKYNLLRPLEPIRNEHLPLRPNTYVLFKLLILNPADSCIARNNTRASAISS